MSGTWPSSDMKMRVTWGDCDAAGIHYYARTFDWFTNARMHFFASNGFPYMDTFHHAGISLVCLTADCRFTKMLRPEEEITIRTSLTALTFLRPYDLPEMAGSAGRACTDDEVAVVKVYPDRRAEPDDYAAKDGKEVGEIIVKAPGKTTYAYVNQEAESEKVFYKGWIYIGDMGTWDENEYLTIVGRKNNMIISSGENIHPVQIEEILNQHPKVKESIVVGVPDGLRGEAVTAYVIKADPSLTAKELHKYCSEHPMLAAYKRPRYYRFVDDLPYTATGKKKHYEVKKRAAEDGKQGLLERP